MSGQARILTTHAGSLPRPRELVELYLRRARGEDVDREIAAAGKAALSASIDRQIAAGIDIVGNGEQQRDSFFLYLRQRLSGFGGGWTRRVGADRARYPDFMKQLQSMSGRPSVSNFADVPEAVGEVHHLGAHIPEAECRDFRDALAARRTGFTSAFLTAASPGIVAAAVRNRFFKDDDDYLQALGVALAVEYRVIVESGFMLQIDAPDLAVERHVTYQDRPLGDFLEFARKVVDTINRSLEGIPPDRVRLHVCWGNYEGPHDCDVPLRDIIPVLAKANVGEFVLPFANPRHGHEYRELPSLLGSTRRVVAGVVDTTTNYVEHPELVADRIERIAMTLGDPRRVTAGTDCGFDTSAGAGRVAADVVWSKLASLVEGSRIASQRLFR